MPAADLADRRVLGERRERVAQRALELAAALDEALALVDVEHRQRGRAARRVAGVGGAVAEHRAAGPLEERRRRPRRETTTPPSGR